MANIYIAGKYEDRIRVKELMSLFEAFDHTITYDWTKNQEGDSSVICAITDLEAVKKADIVLAIAEKDYIYKGMYVEIGIALALSKKVLLLGNAIDRCIFSTLCYKVDIDELRRALVHGSLIYGRS